jgi:2-polyprenyl-3-methyl-5-hydroxy-6-metoxy-1,4-benzoquinol methylase
MEWFESEDFWRDFYPYMFSAERFAAAKEEVSRIMALTQCGAGSLLDLSCGPGRHVVEFAQRGFRVTGVDRSPFLLDRAREHGSKACVSIEWIMDDYEELRSSGNV